MRESPNYLCSGNDAGNKNSGVGHNDGAAFYSTLRKILGQLGVPFTCLGGYRTMGSSSLFRSATHVKTLVRLHRSFSPGHHFGAR